MAQHVVTARIYTGGLYFLCPATSGKLGGWCIDPKQALMLSTSGEAEQLFDGICTHLQNPMRRAVFDPDMLMGLRKLARLVEFGVGQLENGSVTYRRRRIVDISPLSACVCQVVKLAGAA